MMPDPTMQYEFATSDPNPAPSGFAERLYAGHEGWRCPSCGRIISPYYPWCIFCQPPKTTTSNTIQKETL